MPSFRMKRVSELIKETLGDILIKTKDPRIGFFTITNVDVTSDLSLAKIYVSAFEDEEKRKETLEGLNSASGFLRKELGKQIRLKKTPKLVFYFDPGIERGSKIIEIINKVVSHEEKEN
ncbi:MAG: 30S ribosome-binding factor RbfA [Vulcanimicrobiota bacterium]